MRIGTVVYVYFIPQKTPPMPPLPELTKRYYSTGEVAALFGVSTSLIRFWEGEFDHLQPHKNGKGERRFTPKNVQQFNEIHELVKGRGFTLAGARRELERQKGERREREDQIAKLEELRRFLVELREAL